MRTNKSCCFVILFLFLFSCGEKEKIELEPYNYAELIGTVTYSTRIQSAQCTNIPRPVDTYIYPIVPETDEWMKLHEKGMEEVIKACRVPEDILRNQSTPAVIQTFFDYPYVLDIFTSSSTLLNGFNNSVKYNSAYAELLKREDAGNCLLDRYILHNPVGCSFAILTTPLLDLLLAQPEFYSQLDINKQKELIETALQKINIRVDYDPQLIYQNETTCLFIGRIMVNANFSPFVKKVKEDKSIAQYLESQSRDFGDYSTILSYADKFVK